MDMIRKFQLINLYFSVHAIFCRSGSNMCHSFGYTVGLWSDIFSCMDGGQVCIYFYLYSIYTIRRYELMRFVYIEISRREPYFPSYLISTDYCPRQFKWIAEVFIGCFDIPFD